MIKRFLKVIPKANLYKSLSYIPKEQFIIEKLFKKRYEESEKLREQ